MSDEKQKIEEAFKLVVKECARSFTKKNLHPDPVKEEVLAEQLGKAFARYGEIIAGRFQKEYEKPNPALSFLFAQVSNAVVEKVFHQGSCHAQASYAFLELAKKGIFKASMVCSETGNLLTEHWYLLILDEFTLGRLPQLNPQSTFIRVNSPSIHQDSLFFDTWSNILRPYKDFKHFESQNDYIKHIKTTGQIIVRPLLHLFKTEMGVIENIIRCLDEYEKRLKELVLNKMAIPERIAKLFVPEDIEFQKEIELLFNPEQCISKLFATIESYRKDFQDHLNLFIEQQEKELSVITDSFFKQQSAPWKKYPAARLTGKYVGHPVRFFSLKESSLVDKSDSFIAHLKKKGFSPEKREIEGTPPFIFLDLAESTLRR